MIYCQDCCSCLNERTAVTGCSNGQIGAVVTFQLAGATVATCTTSGTVSAVVVNQQGSNYTSPPTVTFGGTGVTWTTPAAASAVLGGSSVNGVSVTAGGSGYTSAPTVTPSYGNATFVARLSPTAVGSVAVNNVGFLYGPTVTIAPPSSGRRATATVNLSGGHVASIAITDGGTGYTSAPGVTIAGGGGTGATANATVIGGAVTGITITNGGNNYGPAVVFDNTGTNGTGATATATVTNGAVTSIQLGSGGSGYTSVPAVTLSGGGGAGATATAILAGTSVASVSFAGTNNNYTYLGGAPNLAFSGGGGAGAAATATIANSFKVTSFTVTDSGAGYSARPDVVLSGGGGTGAVGTATMDASCTVALPSAGTYTRTITQGGFVTHTATFSRSCGTDVNTTVNLTIATGYTCSSPGCCPAGDCYGGRGPCPDTFFAEQYYADDGHGTVTLNRTIAGTSLVWKGTAARQASQAYDTCPASGSWTTIPNANVDITFTLACNLSGGQAGKWTLGLSGDTCSNGAGQFGQYLTKSGFGQTPITGPSGQVTAQTCLLFNESFSCFITLSVFGTPTPNGPFASVYGSSAFPVTVTK